MTVRWFAIATLSVLVAVPVQAAAPASDDAADPAYDDGWQSGDDGGTGWAGGWGLATNGVVEAGEAGHQIESSTTNGDGDSDGDGDIDTEEGRAWGLFTQYASGIRPQASAFRALAGGPLEIGQTLSLELDHGFAGVDFVGFDLLAGAVSCFDFRWSSGTLTYSVQGQDSGVTATDEGVLLDFSLTAAGGFSLDVTPLDGTSTTTFTGPLVGSGGIDLLRVFLQADDTGVRAEAFANRIEVPEPGADAARIAALGLVLGLVRARRRSRPPAPARAARSQAERGSRITTGMSRSVRAW
jgi:hypothetical protein